MALGVLRNPQHELFAQGIARGKPRDQAYIEAGFKAKNPKHASYNIWKRKEVRARIDELLSNAANRSELSRKAILDRILDDWDTARKLGQMASALKAGELLGKEMHKMFVERKEIGGAGDFDNKSEDELRTIVEDGLKDLGWDNPPKVIN